MTWGLHVSLTPTWFDPAEAIGLIAPFMLLYALHDVMVKAMPGPCELRILLAASSPGVRSGKGQQLLAEAGYPNGIPPPTGGS